MGGTRRDDRLATVIAFLVATVSILSAVAAGRAAVWASAASAYDSTVLQESIERQQLESLLKETAAVDMRFAARYDAEYRQDRALTDAADALRARDPAAAALRDLQRQTAWGVGTALWRYFRASEPDYDADGKLIYDPEADFAQLVATDPRLTQLTRSLTPGRAADARRRTGALIASVVLFVGALFLLTIAEVWSGRGRRVALLLGALAAAVSAGVVIVTDPDMTVVVGLVLGVALVGMTLAVGVPWIRRGRARAAAAGAAPAGRASSSAAGADPSWDGAVVPGSRAMARTGSGADLAEIASVATATAGEPGEGADSGPSRFRAVAAVLIAAATLLGAGVGVLQAAAADGNAAATLRAQDEALVALAEHHRTMAWAWTQVEIWSEVEEHRTQADGSRQLTRYLASIGDKAGAAAARADADRWLAVADATATLTELSDDHPDGPAADPDFPARYLIRAVNASADRTARQDLANEESSAWGARGAAYVAILATIAIAAYLLGLSLVLRVRRLRGLFAVVGVGLLVSAAVAAAVTAAGPTQQLDATTQDAIATAYRDATVELAGGRHPDDPAAAVAGFTEVLRLHPQLARAHVGLASALMAAGTPVTATSQGVTTIGAARDGLVELERAAALGWDDLGTRGDMGFARLLVGLGEPRGAISAQAVVDTASALTLGAELPPLQFNHAAALLADGRVEEARAAYDDGIATVMAVRDGGAPVFGNVDRARYAAAAITDLEMIAATRGDEPAVVAAVADLKAAVLAGTGDPMGPGAEGSPARVTELAAEYDVSGLWWTARIDDFDPARDVLSVLWLAEDPSVPGWHALPRHTGPMRLDQHTVAGDFYADTEPSRYVGSQGYLATSHPSRCLPAARYRVELYLDGRLATDPVTITADPPPMAAEQPWDLGLRFCRPAAWTVTEHEAGSQLTFSDADGQPVLQVSRVFRPALDGDAETGEVVAALDAIAAAWPGSPALLAGQHPLETYWVGLDHGVVQWYGNADHALKVIGGATPEGTVLAVTIAGTGAYVDSDAAIEILASFDQL